MLPVRLVFFRKTAAALQKGTSLGERLFRLPWREFLADVAAWAAIGLLTVVVYYSFYQPYATTGPKILVGCIAFGIFGGMISFLNAEKEIVRTLNTSRAEPIRPNRLIPVSRKMVVLIIAMLCTMALALLLMVLHDIYYLLQNRHISGPEIYWGVFKEILFALAVLLALSLMILRRYAQVLRRTLDIQLSAMEEISRGNLDRQVPVLSRDEFATVALKTNEMLQGLKERDFCRSSFGKYVSPEISQMVLDGDISPEGSTYDATILFCDLRDYTAFVENRDPKSVVAFMNHYFSIMQGIIDHHGGMVLQYIGDEIEAVFGAPVRTADHPDCAVRAAEEMRIALDRLNTERRGRGRPEVHHGIGIHSGTVLAGNVGSADRMVYAMVGDTVNVASRLQVLNKTLGTGILLSRQTHDRLESPPRTLRSMGTFPLKGKREEVEVFTIAWEPAPAPD